MENCAQFLRDRKWGIFNHYLWHDICAEGNSHNRGTGVTDWNTAVNMFDVERLAYTLHQMNAGYYFITLQQGTRHLLAPNETFDKIAGTKPGEACATRDLPLELYEALSKYDIDLCLYYTGDGPHFDPVLSKKFDCFTGDFDEKRPVDEKFCTKWASVLEDDALCCSRAVRSVPLPH